MPRTAEFDGYPAKVVREPGQINVYYGGTGTPDGEGHGHVKAQGGKNGENIVFWRLPASEGGSIVIDNFASRAKLKDMLTYH